MERASAYYKLYCRPQYYRYTRKVKLNLLNNVFSNFSGFISAFQFLSITFVVVCIYTLLLFGGLAPLCGIGVVSLIDNILNPLD